jgi:hypothetical protein
MPQSAFMLGMRTDLDIHPQTDLRAQHPLPTDPMMTVNVHIASGL